MTWVPSLCEICNDKTIPKIEMVFVRIFLMTWAVSSHPFMKDVCCCQPFTQSKVGGGGGHHRSPYPFKSKGGWLGVEIRKLGAPPHLSYIYGRRG